jgi:hypothetical protein
MGCDRDDTIELLERLAEERPWAVVEVSVQ